MITLVGTKHSDVNDRPLLLDDALLSKIYGEVFSEGFSKEVHGSIDQDELVDDLEDMLGREIEFTEGDYVSRGIESRHMEESGIVRDGFTALDDFHPEYLITSQILLDKEQPSNTGITRKQMEDKLMEDNVQREDLIDYLRFLRDEQVANFGYVSISNPQRFENFKRDISTDFIQDTTGLTYEEAIKNTHDQYQEAFLNGLNQYGIDRFDLQEIAEEERLHFQDTRDRNWFHQITEYLENNPDEDILVVAGTRHIIDGENTLRRLLEEEYSSSQVDVKPVDYWMQ